MDMAARDRLHHDEIRRRLDRLPGWALRDGKLHREFTFPDFIRAFAFMAGAALRAEAMGHHPEWFNVYNRVVVDLTTHDAQGITALDFELADHMQLLATGV
jgi:4a-hydroxytetrahydrobiopterin dehydratase